MGTAGHKGLPNLMSVHAEIVFQCNPLSNPEMRIFPSRRRVVSLVPLGRKPDAHLLRELSPIPSRRILVPPTLRVLKPIPAGRVPGLVNIGEIQRLRGGDLQPHREPCRRRPRSAKKTISEGRPRKGRIAAKRCVLITNTLCSEEFAVQPMKG